MKQTITVLLFVISIVQIVYASPYPKVDTDLAEYDKTIVQMKSDFMQIPSDPNDKKWVRLKLDFMFNTDQYMRSMTDVPFNHHYTEEEKQFFWQEFSPRFKDVDANNTADLKKLLKIYEWFKISDFEAQGDNEAWIIVQHADNDPDFQKQILPILERLYPINETSPRNYGYLF